jgi:uncharacterized protein YceH (UPF0502 family)
MQLELNPHEARVLGVLIEKAFTTPDVYPLTLNAATNGSNQRSNRDPVVDFSEAEVVVALQGLQMKQIAGGSFPAGSRVEKWHHNGREHLSVDDPALAVLAELLLRGPQTPGELRTRASRMRTIASLEALQQILERLMTKGYVERLPPGGGVRVERYAQLLAPSLHLEGEPPPVATPRAVSPVRSAAPSTGGALGDRVNALESEVALLRRQLDSLASKLGESLLGS